MYSKSLKRLLISAFSLVSTTIITACNHGQENLKISQNNVDSEVSQYTFPELVPIQKNSKKINSTNFIFVYGGRLTTVHASNPKQVVVIANQSNVPVAINGTFFDMSYNTSNKIIGPVMSSRSNNGKFIPDTSKNLEPSKDRPLVLISQNQLKIIPFDPTIHNELKAVTDQLNNVTDIFVGAIWLVKNSVHQDRESFKVKEKDERRKRAFLGLNSLGQPVLGISTDDINCFDLGIALEKDGWKEAIMLDSGQSTSLTYQNKSLISGYIPRPIPHVIGLVEK
jgi:poly-beta-1,6-N-acetyl-D-glucosamine N-deacetylase